MKLQIAIDDQRYEVEVEITEDDTSPRLSYLPPNQGSTVVPSRTGVAAPKSAAPSFPVADESKVCRSPIAGLVIRVNVQPGQMIQSNDLLLVLEAMKMETNVTAPTGGRIKIVNVHQGDAVQLNQVLVEFE